MTIQDIRKAAKEAFPGRTVSVTSTAWCHEGGHEYTTFSMCVQGVSSEEHGCVAIECQNPEVLIDVMKARYGDKLGIEKTDVLVEAVVEEKE